MTARHAPAASNPLSKKRGTAGIEGIIKYKRPSYEKIESWEAFIMTNKKKQLYKPGNMTEGKREIDFSLGNGLKSMIWQNQTKICLQKFYNPDKQTKYKDSKEEHYENDKDIQRVL